MVRPLLAGRGGPPLWVAQREPALWRREPGEGWGGGGASKASVSSSPTGGLRGGRGVGSGTVDAVILFMSLGTLQEMACPKVPEHFNQPEGWRSVSVTSGSQRKRVLLGRLSGVVASDGPTALCP